MVPYMFSATLIAILSLCLNLFIIPEANKTRLDFENQYIKERTKSDTEAITHKIRHFLSIALLSNDYDKVFNAISDDIKDLLDISTTNDIKNIMSNITCKIQFETVKTIIQ